MKKVLPLLAKEQYYRRLKSGKGRGGEAGVMVEDIRMFVDILGRHERARPVLATDGQTKKGGLSHPLQTVYAPALPAFMR